MDLRRARGQTNNAIHLCRPQMLLVCPPAHCGQMMASVRLLKANNDLQDVLIVDIDMIKSLIQTRN
jgi:hypothetical protein